MREDKKEGFVTAVGWGGVVGEEAMVYRHNEEFVSVLERR
jgi:hypothetical protein